MLNAEKSVSITLSIDYFVSTAILNEETKNTAILHV